MHNDPSNYKYNGIPVNILLERNDDHPLQLRGAWLPNICLAGLDLSKADFSGANLAGADLSRSKLQESSFASANLSDATLHRANLSGANLCEATLNRANLRRAKLKYAFLTSAHLVEAKLSNANCTGAHFDFAVLDNVSMIDAKFEWANFRHASMRNSYLARVDMNNVNASHADFSNTTFEKVNFHEANLSNAILNDATLTDLTLSGTNLSGVKGLLSATEWLLQFETDSLGIIVYKRIGDNTMYRPPEHWIIEPNSFLTEEANPDRTIMCGNGINFGTRKWCEHNMKYNDLWKCRIHWQDLASVVVPYNTDGKARCGRLELLSIVERKGEL